ncbi:hypothetical protein MA16_Dca002785 [Dendrobium catenatum]|uniref:Uncharacterized protein n=1 Tax=Dendrobium catenatum TaxID=906689 RepID=A0A2I0X8P6_9ASPA|nr:hypothetical protein MA16_Dca002785 [Dendrobium catenatum]
MGASGGGAASGEFEAGVARAESEAFAVGAESEAFAADDELDFVILKRRAPAKQVRSLAIFITLSFSFSCELDNHSSVHLIEK